MSCHRFYTSPHVSGGLLWYHVGYPCVRPYVRLSCVRPYVFSFPDDNLSKCQRIFHQTWNKLILRRSGLGLIMGKFRQFFTKLSACGTSIFSFPDENLSKNEWAFTKLGLCIDIVKIWLWIVKKQSSSFLQNYLPAI